MAENLEKNVFNFYFRYHYDNCTEIMEDDHMYSNVADVWFFDKFES